MFTDGRSKKVLFIAHCILNQNSISNGTASFPAANKEVLQILLDADVGIIQMPCPELFCLGLDRGNIHGAKSEVVVENTRIRSEMLNPTAKNKLDELAEQIIYQIKQYRKHRYQVLGIIGINRSPCCGVETTSSMNQETAGKGVFISKINELLEKHNINTSICGIKSNDYDSIRKLLT